MDILVDGMVNADLGPGADRPPLDPGYRPLITHAVIGSRTISVTAVCPNDSHRSCRRTWQIKTDQPDLVLDHTLVRIREAKWAVYNRGGRLMLRCPRHRGKRRPTGR